MAHLHISVPATTHELKIGILQDQNILTFVSVTKQLRTPQNGLNWPKTGKQKHAVATELQPKPKLPLETEVGAGLQGVGVVLP